LHLRFSMLRPCLLWLLTPVVMVCIVETSCHQRAAQFEWLFRPYRILVASVEPRMGFVGAKEYPLKGGRTHSSGRRVLTFSIANLESALFDRRWPKSTF